MTPTDLRRRWRTGEEVALLDVREEGPYSQAHPFFAVSLPLPQIELRILDLIPRRTVPIVVYDNGEGLAEQAIERIEAIGYQDVSMLAGGLSGYGPEGELFRDVNVPSKAFGELVEAIRHTPSLPACEVKALLDSGADVAVLDARRFEEYRAMSIPSGVSVPGAELALRVFDLVPSPQTLVIVNCAGRTRSIIGAQSLVNAGIPNRVAALRNGTIGWTLEGYALETGQTRRYQPASERALETARTAAARWAERARVRSIDRATLDAFVRDRDRRTLYLFDVRSPEEYSGGHPAGFQSAPGGQLVQATDEWAGVRGARMVLFDDDGVRARITASWLVQMGWEAVVVETGLLGKDETGLRPPQRPPRPDPGVAAVSASQLAAEGANATVVDLARSPIYHAGHIPAAHFVLASRFADDLAAVPGPGPITLTCPDGDLSLYALASAAGHTSRPIRALKGGTAAWRQAGLAIETDRHSWISPQIDVYKRPYEGTDNARAAMQGYIDWELQLVAQLANDGVSRFHVVR